jgi:hypothetical protein
LLLSVILVGAIFTANRAYDAVQGSWEGELAMKQLSDDPAERALGRAAAQSNLPGVAWGLGGLALLGIWGPYAFGVAHYTLRRNQDE